MMPTIRVVAAVLIADGRVLAARRRPDQSDGGLWELPGGKVEPGEADWIALRRELREELGVELAPGILVGSSTYYTPKQAIHLVAYSGHVVDGELSPKVHEEIAWMSADEIEARTWAPADRPLLPTVTKLLG